MEGAYLRGNVSQRYVPREWAPPIRTSVDPEKDAVADIVEERAGYALHDDNLAKRGHNPATFYERRKAELESMDESGGKYDTDPRNTNFRGASAVSSPPPAPSSSEPPAEEESSP